MCDIIHLIVDLNKELNGYDPFATKIKDPVATKKLILGQK